MRPNSEATHRHYASVLEPIGENICIVIDVQVLICVRRAEWDDGLGNWSRHVAGRAP